jgi:hypothetical protein
VRRQSGFCKHHNLELANVFTDSGVSACKGKNFSPDFALGKFYELAQKGQIEKGSVLSLKTLAAFPPKKLQTVPPSSCGSLIHATTRFRHSPDLISPTSAAFVAQCFARMLSDHELLSGP